MINRCRNRLSWGPSVPIVNFASLGIASHPPRVAISVYILIASLRRSSVPLSKVGSLDAGSRPLLFVPVSTGFLCEDDGAAFSLSQSVARGTRRYNRR